MSLKRSPFTSTRLEEERALDTDVVFTVRLNKQEQEWLADAKEWFDTDQNSTALKVLVEVGHNVLHAHFGDRLLGWLFKKDRVRAGDFRRPK